MYDTHIANDIQRLLRDYSWSGDIFFQFWCVDKLGDIATKELKKWSGAQEFVNKKKYLNSQFLERYNWKPSWREHMPDATIQLDLTNTLPELKKDFSSSWKRYLNKAKKQELTFHEATEKEREKFRNVRYAMAYDKGFSVVPKEQFLLLMKYLIQTKQWTLLLSKKWSSIVSGNVLLFHGDELIYLYGATDRSFWHIGSHYRLMYETMRRWRDHDFLLFDLLWVAPPGAQEGHYLEWVTRFKQSFGWKTISYVWNYDVVCNNLLYNTFKILKR
jgi:lipid II:glycine glycyltransferase (peptidoglycan interpeptide bridge formation enzyme)